MIEANLAITFYGGGGARAPLSLPVCHYMRSWLDVEPLVGLFGNFRKPTISFKLFVWYDIFLVC